MRFIVEVVNKESIKRMFGPFENFDNACDWVIKNTSPSSMTTLVIYRLYSPSDPIEQCSYPNCKCNDPCML